MLHVKPLILSLDLLSRQAKVGPDRERARAREGSFHWAKHMISGALVSKLDRLIWNIFT